MSRKPTVGITTYNYSPEDIMNLAVHADRLGFEGRWFGEHYVIPENYGSHHPTKTGNATETGSSSKVPGKSTSGGVNRCPENVFYVLG